MSISTDFAAALQNKFNADLALQQARGEQEYATPTEFSVESGNKFDRIVIAYNGQHRSVHAFIEKSTSKLIKAGGWKAPQKDSMGNLAYRYDLSTPSGFKAAVDAADKHGSYLYAR